VAIDGFIVHMIGQVHRGKEECVSYFNGIKSVIAKRNYDFHCE
jgi:hypothetical protein